MNVMMPTREILKMDILMSFCSLNSDECMGKRVSKAALLPFQTPAVEITRWEGSIGMPYEVCVLMLETWLPGAAPGGLLSV